MGPVFCRKSKAKFVETKKGGFQHSVESLLLYYAFKIFRFKAIPKW